MGFRSTNCRFQVQCLHRLATPHPSHLNLDIQYRHTSLARLPAHVPATDRFLGDLLDRELHSAGGIPSSIDGLARVHSCVVRDHLPQDQLVLVSLLANHATARILVHMTTDTFTSEQHSEKVLACVDTLVRKRKHDAIQENLTHAAMAETDPPPDHLAS